jgi:hypothetical protein
MIRSHRSTLMQNRNSIGKQVTPRQLKKDVDNGSQTTVKTDRSKGSNPMLSPLK